VVIVDGLNPGDIAAACALPVVMPPIPKPLPVARKRKEPAPLPPPPPSWGLDHVGQTPPSSGNGLLVLHAPCNLSCKVSHAWQLLLAWLRGL
jgi:hypothetical protein